MPSLTFDAFFPFCLSFFSDPLTRSLYLSLSATFIVAIAVVTLVQVFHFSLPIHTYCLSLSLSTFFFACLRCVCTLSFCAFGRHLGYTVETIQREYWHPFTSAKTTRPFKLIAPVAVAIVPTLPFPFSPLDNLFSFDFNRNFKISSVCVCASVHLFLNIRLDHGSLHKAFARLASNLHFYNGKLHTI